MYSIFTHYFYEWWWWMMIMLCMASLSLSIIFLTRKKIYSSLSLHFTFFRFMGFLVCVVKLSHRFIFFRHVVSSTKLTCWNNMKKNYTHTSLFLSFAVFFYDMTRMTICEHYHHHQDRLQYSTYSLLIWLNI